MATTLGESGTQKLPPSEVFSQDVMACLHRLEEGQHRLEAELRRMQGLHFGDLPSTDQKPTSSSDSLREAASTRPAGNSDPKELSAFPESLNDKEENVRRLEDALVTINDQKDFTLQLNFIDKHRKSLYALQSEAYATLFHAHTQARGWMADHPVECIENDPKADEEARQRGKHVKAWLNTQIKNGKFDMFFGLFIILNSLLMLLRLEEEGQQLGYSEQFLYKPPLEWVQAKRPLYHINDDALFGMELVFLTIFTLELILRLWVHYRICFKHIWNYFDAVIVVFAWIEIIYGSLPFNLALMRLLRLVRFARILRFVRVMHRFQSLRVLVETAVASLPALLWSVLLIGLILLVTACLMAGLTQWIFSDESVDRDVREQVWRTWGTFGHAFYTLFRWTMSSSWALDTDLLLLGVNPWFGFFIFPFILTVNFALMRIVIALFIRETFAVSKKDAMTVLEECMRKDNATMEALRAIFVEFDTDGKGGVSKEEFEEAMQDPRLQNYLRSLEVNPRQAASIFTLMDHGLGQLSPEELTAGAMDLRAGGGRPTDIITTRYENMKSMLVLRSIEQQVSMMLKFLEHTVLQEDDVKQAIHENIDVPHAHLKNSGDNKEAAI